MNCVRSFITFSVGHPLQTSIKQIHPHFIYVFHISLPNTEATLLLRLYSSTTTFPYIGPLRALCLTNQYLLMVSSPKAD